MLVAQVLAGKRRNGRHRRRAPRGNQKHQRCRITASPDDRTGRKTLRGRPCQRRFEIGQSRAVVHFFAEFTGGAIRLVPHAPSAPLIESQRMIPKGCQPRSDGFVFGVVRSGLVKQQNCRPCFIRRGIVQA